MLDFPKRFVPFSIRIAVSNWRSLCRMRGEYEQDGWVAHADGELHPTRAAEFWHALDGDRVQCDLCYRRCKLKPGQFGFCTYRMNEGGRMIIPYYGLTALVMYDQGHAAGLWCVNAPSYWHWGILCNSRCDFCTGPQTSQTPEDMPWATGPWLPAFSDFSLCLAVVPPEMLVERARAAGAVQICMFGTEPMVSFEYSYDLAKLAHAAGLRVLLNSNGLGNVAAIERIAPYVDAVGFGLKGGLSPEFYRRHMKAPGDAAGAVKASLVAWQRCGVQLMLSDIVMPDDMQDAADRARSQAATYAWIAQNLGTNCVSLLLNSLYKPGSKPFSDGLTSNALLDEAWTRAKAAGLHYTLIIRDGESLTCHHCGATVALLRRNYNTAVDKRGMIFSLSVHGDRCAHCGGQVPIRE
jgi:pyruvate formate lyase activating enzyme